MKQEKSEQYQLPEIQSVITRYLQYEEKPEQDRLSRNAAAKAMGINSGRLTDFLNKKYAGNITDTADRVRNFLENQSERELLEPNKDGIASGVYNTEEILKLSKLCHIEDLFGLIVGPSGAGKTYALQAYAREHKDVIYIEIDRAYSAKEVFKEIASQLKAPEIGHLNTIKKEIIKRLKGTGRLVIIDQAEYLPVRALDLLRTIFDKAGVGIVIAGMQGLLNNLKGVDGLNAQIYSRIGAFVQLDKLNDDDIKALVHHLLPGSNGLWKDIAKYSDGNARTVSILAKQCKRIAKMKNMAVDSSVVKTASLQLVR
jgi:DNA transposition AAA+ family ATPase